MSEELKPCPFCNAAAETDFIPERGSYRIECETLNCATGPICSTEADAIAAWNRRATPAPAQPEGAKTGWPPGMLQDDDRKLSRALADTPHARANADEAAAAIKEMERIRFAAPTSPTPAQEGKP